MILTYSVFVTIWHHMSLICKYILMNVNPREEQHLLCIHLHAEECRIRILIRLSGECANDWNANSCACEWGLALETQVLRLEEKRLTVNEYNNIHLYLSWGNEYTRAGCSKLFCMFIEGRTWWNVGGGVWQELLFLFRSVSCVFNKPDRLVCGCHNDVMMISIPMSLIGLVFSGFLRLWVIVPNRRLSVN